MDEKQLLELSKQGNEEAFQKLVEQTVIKIKASIHQAYNPLNPEDFKDALQVASFKAWNKIESFRGEACFSTWFYMILKNEVLNVLHTRNNIRKHEYSLEEMCRAENKDEVDYERVPAGMLDEAVLDTAQTILEKQDEVKEYKKMLEEVLSKLKPAHSQIIRMNLDEGKSYLEISEELNIPIGTVMSRLYFARKNAQKLIKQYAQRNNLQLSSLGRSK